MLHFPRQRNPFLLPSLILMALALMFCEPGKSLDPTPSVVPPPADTGKVANIEVLSAPGTVLPGDTASIQIAITDTATGLPLKGAKLSITSTSFSVIFASSTRIFDLDSVPDDGKVGFRIYSSTPGNGSVNIRVTSVAKIRSKSVAVIITEKPVAPKIVESLPKNVAAKETTMVAFTIVDSAQEKPLANAAVTVSSALYSIFSPASKDTLSTDTTGNDGKVKFRVYSAVAGGAGSLRLRRRPARPPWAPARFAS